MTALKTRWKLILATRALAAAWGALAPASLFLAVGLLSAFGFLVAWVQSAIESSPERRQSP